MGLAIWLGQEQTGQSGVQLQTMARSLLVQDGLYFLQLMKWGILQYCWIRPFTTLAAIILEQIGYYCEASWSPKFGSVWASIMQRLPWRRGLIAIQVLIVVSVSVTIAMLVLSSLAEAIS